jgi:CubicO group peptidase (beta-lactamase class C family)
MAEHHVAGAVVGITDSSGTLFLRKYGSADLEKRIPVDPRNTLFRAGSISRLFTGAPALQRLLPLPGSAGCLAGLLGILLCVNICHELT